MSAVTRLDADAWASSAHGAPRTADAFVPHVVAWNLTRRCNLKCTHCYISAGPWETAEAELDTATCRRIVDELIALNPAPLLILSGGEPLARDDLPQIAAYAVERGATVVVGTNGTLLTDDRIGALRTAGVSGVAVSVDSLRPERHNDFRGGRAALERTLQGVERMRSQHLDFIVQTSATAENAAEIPALMAWAAEQGAVSFNCYFLVPTGRGEQLAPLAPEAIEDLLGVLVAAEREYRGRMMVRAKCAPHFMRRIHQASPDSPVLNYKTRCSCGIDYCRITPEGKLTPCPYMPEVAGDLRTQSFADVWQGSALFAALRRREVTGRCGRCEYRLICGGCRARALATSGDVLAEDPACAYQPTGAEPVIPRPALPYGASVAPTLTWTAEAEERMRRIPSFVRGVVVSRVETWARERGLSVVTPELLGEVRSAMPIDFSKRIPFFARHD